MSGMRSHLVTVLGCSVLVPVLFLTSIRLGLPPTWAVAIFGFLTLSGGIALGYFMPSWSLALPVTSACIFFYPYPDYVIGYPAVRIILLSICMGFVFLSHHVIVRNFVPQRSRWITAATVFGYLLADSITNMGRDEWLNGLSSVITIVSSIVLVTLIILSDRGEKAAHERGARILRRMKNDHHT